MICHLIITNCGNDGEFCSRIEISPCAPGVKIFSCLGNSLKSRLNDLAEILFIILLIKAEIPVNRSNIIVFQNSRVKAIGRRPLTAVLQILLCLFKELCGIKFLVAQSIGLFSLQQFIRLCHTGMIQVIVSRTGKYND